MSLLNSKINNYIISKSADEVIINIKADKALNSERLQRLYGKTYCINYSTEHAFLFRVSADDIEIISLRTDNEIQGRMFSMLPVSLMALDRCAVEKHMANEEVKIAIQQLTSFINILLNTIVFIEFASPEIKFVVAGKKNSVRPIGYTNDAPFPVSIVDSTWNKYIVRTEGFGVSGHFRLQPCGEGLKDLKLVWINAYQKNGYVRKPKSEIA